MFKHHAATREEYGIRVTSTDGKKYVYIANVINNHISKTSETDVYCLNGRPEDHDDIVTKIEE